MISMKKHIERAMMIHQRGRGPQEKAKQILSSVGLLTVDETE